MRRNTVYALLAIAALLGSSCVSDRDAEPGVRAITTDLQYKELREKSAAPPNTIPSPPEQPREQARRRTPSPFDQAPVGPVTPPNLVCPTAAPTETADEDVTSEKVEGRPANGEYLWKVDGYEKFENNKLSLPLHVKKKIENTKVDGDVMTFEVVEKELSATNPNAPTVRSFFRVTETGVQVDRIERKPPKGASSIFAPVDPIRYIVLPVAFGPEEAWVDQSIDVLSGEPQVFTQEAYVKGRLTVDACGERLRGWHVVADQTYRKGSESVRRHFEYGVATHMGGIVIAENVWSPCNTWDVEKEKCTGEEDAVLRFDSNIGQREPS